MIDTRTESPSRPVPPGLDLHRLPVAKFALLSDLAAALRSVRPPDPPYTELGDFAADIDAGPPAKDRPRPFSYRRQIMQRSELRLHVPDGVMVASLNYYPVGGGVGWHTDSKSPGWRVYLALPMGPGRGAFITRDRFAFDDPDFALAFRVGPGAWHAVDSPGPRLSAGLHFVPGAFERLYMSALEGVST